MMSSMGSTMPYMGSIPKLVESELTPDSESVPEEPDSLPVSPGGDSPLESVPDTSGEPEVLVTSPVVEVSAPVVDDDVADVEAASLED